jgi:hypothetical protein
VIRKIESSPSPRARSALRWLIVAATFAAFLPVCRHEFTTWDDRWTIETNPWLNPPSLHGLRAAWTTADKGLYIPITYTAWSALSAVSQVHDPATGHSAPNPWVFHSANLLLHILAALAVFSILCRLSRHPPGACAAALLFALHPVQVDSVAWASGMKDVLCGLLSLLAIRLYLASIGAGSDAPRRRGRRLRYLLATLAFIAAMLAKPTAMVVPFIVAAIDGLILRRRPRAVLKFAGPWLVLAAPVAIIAKIVQPGLGIHTTPPWTRIFIASDAITFYLRKLLWPAHLAVIYGRTPQRVMEHGWVYLTPLVPIALIIAIALYRPGRRWLAAGAITFLACIGPVLGFTPFLFQFHSTVADHYLYLAMFGVALAAVYFLARFWTRPLAIASAIVLLALGIRTFTQTFTWRDSLTLFAHAVDVAPDSATAQSNLGTSLWDAGDHAGAAPHFIRAIHLRPDYIQAQKNMVMLRTEQGRLDEALAHLKSAVELEHRLPVSLRPGYESDVITLAQILHARGRDDEAMRYLQSLLAEQKSPGAQALLEHLKSPAPPLKSPLPVKSPAPPPAAPPPAASGPATTAP